MAEELLRSKHAFGAEANVDTAIQEGKIDAFDILFLKDADNRAKIGWIDKEGNKVIVEGKKQIVTVEALPETGDTETMYIVGTSVYIWDGTQFVSISGTGGGVDEATVDSKIATAKQEMNDYTDTQVASVLSIVEF